MWEDFHCILKLDSKAYGPDARIGEKALKNREPTNSPFYVWTLDLGVSSSRE